MGKNQSKLDDAAGRVRALEAEGDPARDGDYRSALEAHVRVARSAGDLEGAAASLTKLLAMGGGSGATDHVSGADRARVMCMLSNVLRLQFLNGAGMPPQERTALLARAEDLAIKALETREQLRAAQPDSPELRREVAKSKAVLSMVQSAYGRFEDSSKLHEEALELLAQFPLKIDPEGWVYDPAALAAAPAEAPAPAAAAASATSSGATSKPSASPKTSSSSTSSSAWTSTKGERKRPRTAEPTPTFAAATLAPLPPPASGRTSGAPLRGTASSSSVTVRSGPLNSVASASSMPAPEAGARVAGGGAAGKPAAFSSSSGGVRWRLVLLSPGNGLAAQPAVPRRPSALKFITSRSARNAKTLPAPTDVAGAAASLELTESGADRVEVGLPPPAKEKPQPNSLYVALGPKAKFQRELSVKHAVFERVKPVGGAAGAAGAGAGAGAGAAAERDEGWAVEDLQPSSGKGVRVNGVRVRRAHLKAGDVVTLGGAKALMMGACDTSLGEGLSYVVERFVDGIDDAAVASLVPGSNLGISYAAGGGGGGGGGGAGMGGSGLGLGAFGLATVPPSPHASAPAGSLPSASEAYKHFHLLAVSAQMNLGGPPLDSSRTADLFARAVQDRVPFHLWDTWVHGELAKGRFQI